METAQVEWDKNYDKQQRYEFETISLISNKESIKLHNYLTAVSLAFFLTSVRFLNWENIDCYLRLIESVGLLFLFNGTFFSCLILLKIRDYARRDQINCGVHTIPYYKESEDHKAKILRGVKLFIILRNTCSVIGLIILIGIKFAIEIQK